MNIEELRGRVTAALEAVRREGAAAGILADGHVRDLEVTEDGTVTFDFVLKSGDPGSLVKEARVAAEGVDGVVAVKVNVALPQAQAPAAAAASSSGQAVPGRGPEAGRVPELTPMGRPLGDVQHVIAVSSGKGGVGKSMIAANLAAAFARDGRRVGLLDADIYGPNIPLMFGQDGKPRVSGQPGSEMIEPLESHGVRLMSLGFLLDKDQPAIMRGPLISGILKQFLEQVAWGPLDVMVVDMPPGTGDAQLSLVQTIDLEGAVMVTTPQDISTGDVRRGVRMFERVNTNVLGVIENMSGFTCPHCGEAVDVFGAGGGAKLADDMGLPFLGVVPLDPAIRLAGDQGVPTVVSAPDSPAGRALGDIARALEARLSPAGR